MPFSGRGHPLTTWGETRQKELPPLFCQETGASTCGVSAHHGSKEGSCFPLPCRALSVPPPVSFPHCPAPGRALGQPLPTVGLGHGCLRHFGSAAAAVAPLPAATARERGTAPAARQSGQAHGTTKDLPLRPGGGGREGGRLGNGGSVLANGTRHLLSAPAHAAPSFSPHPSGSGPHVYAGASVSQRLSHQNKPHVRGHFEI